MGKFNSFIDQVHNMRLTLQSLQASLLATSFLVEAKVSKSEPPCYPETYFSDEWFYGGSSAGGVWYHYSTTPRNWQQSVDYCQALDSVSNSTIASIRNSYENDLIMTQLQDVESDWSEISGYLWTGGISFGLGNDYYWYSQNDLLHKMSYSNIDPEWREEHEYVWSYSYVEFQTQPNTDPIPMGSWANVAGDWLRGSLCEVRCNPQRAN